MKKIKNIKIIALVIFINIGFSLDWSGYLSTDQRLLLKEDYTFSFEEYRLSLNPEQTISENLKFHSEIWLRSFGFPYITNLSDLYSKEKVTPFNLDLREAYIDILKFPLKNVDIRIGRQRIAWGTADKINPTDNMNPLDLEDIWDFGRHLSSNGIKIDGYVKDFNLSYMFIPRFTPAILPQGDWFNAKNSKINLPPGIIPLNITNSIAMPGYAIKNSLNGLRLKKNLFGFDFSLSYASIMDGIPILTNTAIVPAGMSGEVNIYNELSFPEMQILGFDFAGAIKDIGIWAEFAVFFPERINYRIDMSQLGMGVIDSVILDKKPYAKYIIGTDYTFKNGIYLNLQYAHGFFYERGEEIEDYLFAGLEWKLLEERLKLMPVSGGLEIEDFSDIKENYALVYMPEISYKPVEDCEISIGLRLIDGKEETNFGMMKENDEVFLKVKYSF